MHICMYIYIYLDDIDSHLNRIKKKRERKRRKKVKIFENCPRSTATYITDNCFRSYLKVK